MSQTPNNLPTLADLTVRELAGLRILNDELWQSEHWIRERAARTLVATVTAAKANADTSEIPTRGSQQQPVFTARILCVGQASPGDCDEHSDNVIASLSGAALLEGNGRRGYEQMAATGEGVLLWLNPCSLFNMLFNQVNGDWLRMLDVRSLRLEMAISATRSLDVSRVLSRRDCPRRTSR
jgi:hypothetical protein